MSHLHPPTLDGDAARLPSSSFSTHNLAPDTGFAIWRESVSPLFESQPEQRDRFHAEVETYHLGALLLGMGRGSAQHFKRDRRLRSRDDIDHFFVQLYLKGGYGGTHGGRDIWVRPGDVGILDLGRDFRTQAPDFECLNLVVPRDLLRTYMKNKGDPGGKVFSGDSAMGRILADHMTSIWRTLPTLCVRDSDYVSQALLGVLTACLGSWENQEPAAPQAAATFEAIRSYIERNLDSSELDPAHLCRAFRCSRSFLYRLFESEGGVAHFIQRRRLQRCYRELTQPGGPPRRIGDVAFRWGFANQSHFCRLFHEAFGVTPKEAVQQVRQAAAVRSAASDSIEIETPSYRKWLVDL